MSKTTAFATACLQQLLQNANIALIGDATGLRGSTVPGVLELSLHTADPGAGGDQTTNECAYTNYARITAVRSAVGWTVAAGQGSNALDLAWPIIGATAGSIATHVGVGTAHTGAGSLLRRAAVTFPLWAIGATPLLRIGGLVLQDT